MRTFYHVTTKRKAGLILKKGLLISHKKNVRISKKSVNYVMDSLLYAGYFASEMRWKLKTEVVILEIVGLDESHLHEDTNTGAYSHWWEYDADIPSSMIKKAIKCDTAFWQEHQKRMKEAHREQVEIRL